MLMRKEDSFLNASQILALTNKSLSDSEYLLKLMERVIKIEIFPPIVGVASLYSWVSFEHGQILYKHFGLEQKLQPLVDYRLEIQRNDYSEPMEYINSVPKQV